MSWYNPLDALKWVAGKTSLGGKGTRAPGGKYEYNPNSQNPGVSGGSMSDGTMPSQAPRLSDQTGRPDPWNIDDDMRKRLLAQQSGVSGQFADRAEVGYGQLGGEAAAQRDYLRQLASGQHSISAEQLRQGLQQNQAQQMSNAAGASPQNAASTARLSSILASRQASGMAGAQAIAGLQERQNAQQGLSNVIMQQRGQELQASLGGRQNAMVGYGATPWGQPDKTWTEKYGPAIQAGASAVAAFSDRRLKKNIRRGDKEANETIKGLRSYVFEYMDSKHGKGEQSGIMAQDLERAGLKHAVIDTPEGKMVHGAKAATSALGLVAALGRRVEKLEGGRK